MHFVVSSKTLLQHIQTLTGIIPSGNSTVPVLQNFLFATEENGSLRVTASDLETTVVTSVPEVDVRTPGRVAFPAKFLVDILKTFADVPLSVQVDTSNWKITLSSDFGKYHTAGFDPEEYPSLPVFDVQGSFEVEAVTFNHAISKTMFAAGNDEIRPVMSGILMQVTAEGTNFVATDGNKLVRYKRKDLSSENQFELILSKRPLNLLKSIVGTSEEPISIEYSESNLRFVFGDFIMYSRAVEGNYPAYETVIPKNNPNKLVVDRTALMNALKRVSMFSNKSTYLVKVQLQGNVMQIIGEDLDFNNAASEELSCQYVGEDMEIGLSARFLVEMLSHLEQDSITMEFSSPNKPGILEPTDYQRDIEDITMLMMPIWVG